VFVQAFSIFLFFLTVGAGVVSHSGFGSATDTVNLTYAYLALSTIVCAVITVTTRPAMRANLPEQSRDVSSVDNPE
jgi:hypothetical protein